VQSATLPGLVFAEQNLGQGFNNLSPTNVYTWYGTDIIVEQT
jgi:hypothetical protein